MTETKRGISGSTVKLVAIITMFIDHFAAAVLARVLIFQIHSYGEWSDPLYDIYQIMRMVGRLGFPIFCFLLVEGFEKTGSRTKYAFRLGLFALISEVPFDLAFSAKILEFKYQNVYFTLFLGLLALCAFDFLTKRKLPTAMRWLLWAMGVVFSSFLLLQYFWEYIQRYISENIELWSIEAETAVVWVICLLVVQILLWLLVMGLLLLYGLWKGMDKMLFAGANLVPLSLFMLLAELLRTDYGGMGVLTIAVIYILRRSNVLAMAGGCAVLTLMALNELPAFFAILPAAAYNGKRGLKLKYFFYAFYPVHLFLLWLVTWFMGTASIPAV